MSAFRSLRFAFRRRWPAEPLTTPALDGPPLAVVVIAYGMTHQLRNTLISLLPPYQQDVSLEQYEIQVIDNGSPAPLEESYWKLSPNIRYQHVPAETAPKNPGVAINRAVSATRSPLLCIMIDGARMLTPGVLRQGMHLSAATERAVVEVRGWHLGNKLQNDAVAQDGYTADTEAELLAGIGWPSDGYRLFDIGVPAASMPLGFFGAANESTCLFLSRRMFDALGGYDERYTTPGGGLCNADFFVRAVQAADRVFTMLGEGTFHQVHSGAATGLNGEDRRKAFRQWKKEYERLSRRWHRRAVEYRPILAGHVPPPCRRWMRLDDSSLHPNAVR